MLNSKNNADSIFLNITIYLYNDINLGNKSLALLYNGSNSKKRVLFKLLSFRKYLLK